MNIEIIKKQIRSIPDYPSKGVIFRDLTTMFKHSESLNFLSDKLYQLYKDKGITKVVGIESRGFIMGPIIATRINAGFVPIRKLGKLPADTIQESYEKEYGTDTLEIHRDALEKDDVILIHDDLLATGGTIKAAYNLASNFEIKDIYLNFIVELSDLKGREFLGDKISERTTCLISY